MQEEVQSPKVSGKNTLGCPTDLRSKVSSDKLPLALTFQLTFSQLEGNRRYTLASGPLHVSVPKPTKLFTCLSPPEGDKQPWFSWNVPFFSVDAASLPRPWDTLSPFPAHTALQTLTNADSDSTQSGSGAGPEVLHFYGIQAMVLL